MIKLINGTKLQKKERLTILISVSGKKLVPFILGNYNSPVFFKKHHISKVYLYICP